jgi:hypothetical protein
MHEYYCPSLYGVTGDGCPMILHNFFHERFVSISSNKKTRTILDETQICSSGIAEKTLMPVAQVNAPRRKKEELHRTPPFPGSNGPGFKGFMFHRSDFKIEMSLRWDDAVQNTDQHESMGSTLTNQGERSTRLKLCDRRPFNLVILGLF